MFFCINDLVNIFLRIQKVGSENKEEVYFQEDKKVKVLQIWKNVHFNNKSIVWKDKIKN